MCKTKDLFHFYIKSSCIFGFSIAAFPFRAWICPFRWRCFPFAHGFVPFNGDDSLSRVDLSLSMAAFPFHARICPFRWRCFPFARGFVPFDGGVSLSRADLSLSMAMFPFRAYFCPFQIQKKNRIIAVLFSFISKITFFLVLLRLLILMRFSVFVQQL